MTDWPPGFCDDPANAYSRRISCWKRRVILSPSSYDDSTEFLDSLAIHPYHPLLLAILLGCILCLHKVDVSPCWSANIGTSTYRNPLVNVAYEFVLSPQQSPTCLVCFTREFCEMGDRWPYSRCFVVCCFQDLFRTVYNIII